MINYITQSETTCGDQGCRPLGARSTISWVLENTYYCANGIAVTISIRNPYKSFLLTHQGWVGLYFQKSRVPLLRTVQLIIIDIILTSLRT